VCGKRGRFGRLLSFIRKSNVGGLRDLDQGYADLALHSLLPEELWQGRGDEKTVHTLEVMRS
jgi:hypothetical protein